MTLRFSGLCTEPSELDADSIARCVVLDKAACSTCGNACQGVLPAVTKLCAVGLGGRSTQQVKGQLFQKLSHQSLTDHGGMHVISGRYELFIANRYDHNIGDGITKHNYA